MRTRHGLRFPRLLPAALGASLVVLGACATSTPSTMSPAFLRTYRQLEKDPTHARVRWAHTGTSLIIPTSEQHFVQKTYADFGIALPGLPARARLAPDAGNPMTVESAPVDVGGRRVSYRMGYHPENARLIILDAVLHDGAGMEIIRSDSTALSRAAWKPLDVVGAKFWPTERGTVRPSPWRPAGCQITMQICH